MMNKNNLIGLLLCTLFVTGCATQNKNLSVAEEPTTAENRPESGQSSMSATADETANAREATEQISAQIGRYTTILAKPTPEQKDPMKVIVEINVPDEIQTVGQTIDYLLSRSGYHLKTNRLQELEVEQLFNQPLPQVHRKLGPMTLHNALLTLGGSAFGLGVNLVERTVTYELLPEYK